MATTRIVATFDDVQLHCCRHVAHDRTSAEEGEDDAREGLRLAGLLASAGVEGRTFEHDG